MMDMVSVPNGPKVLIHLGFVHEEACCEWDLRLQNLVTVIILAAKHHLVSNMTQQCSRHVKTLENDSLWPSWSFSKIINIFLAKPLAGLKCLASFWCSGGGIGARLVQTWCKRGSGRFFVHRLAGARNKQFGVGKPIFWCQISIFW
jgi:hypothetical protein